MSHYFFIFLHALSISTTPTWIPGFYVGGSPGLLQSMWLTFDNQHEKDADEGGDGEYPITPYDLLEANISTATKNTLFHTTYTDVIRSLFSSIFYISVWVSSIRYNMLDSLDYRSNGVLQAQIGLTYHWLSFGETKENLHIIHSLNIIRFSWREIIEILLFFRPVSRTLKSFQLSVHVSNFMHICTYLRMSNIFKHKQTISFELIPCVVLVHIHYK